MKRLMVWSVVVALCALVAPVLRADVKTREKTLVKLEGLLGGAFRMFGGSAAKDGITSTVAVKGVRKASIADTTGEIIDLTEQKVYRLDLKKKEYKVVTFAELRKEWEDAKAEAQKNAEEMRKAEKEQAPPPDQQLEVTADIKETGQKKNIAGYDAREVVLTLTAKQKGKTLEESGGYVMTNTMWLGPRIAALDEITQFDLKYIKAVYGDDFAAQAQQLAAAFAMYPSMQPMMAKMKAEGGKLQGTALETTSVFESVKSEAQMKESSSQQSSGGGGGLTGALASRMMGGNKPPKPRSTILTTVHNVLSIETAAADADVAMPAGFKEKK
jgi:hypothetical protein